MNAATLKVSTKNNKWFNLRRRGGNSVVRFTPSIEAPEKDADGTVKWGCARGWFGEAEHLIEAQRILKELRLKSSSGSWGCFPGVKAGQECVYNCGSWTPAGCETEHRLSFAFTSLNLVTSWAALFNRRVISQTHTRFDTPPPSHVGTCCAVYCPSSVCPPAAVYAEIKNRRRKKKRFSGTHACLRPPNLYD